MNDMIETYRAQLLAEHMENGGAAEDFVFAYRKRLAGEYLFLDIDRAVFREMEEEELEEELEDMQDELDEAVEAIEAFEDKNGTLFAVGSELAEQYDELLDERFAIEQNIRVAMEFLRK